MALPDPRRPLFAAPRPRLADDFFASYARSRSLASAPAPALLHAGLRPTGRPHLDTPPIGTAKLARPEFFVVELRDGRPGLIAARDHTRVWTRPPGPHQPSAPSWWDRFLAAITPKAGFILYASDSVLPHAEDPNQYLRHGFVYDAIDVGLLKQTMDMTGAEWARATTKFEWYNRMMNNLAYPTKNLLTMRDATNAVVAVKESVVGTPKVNVVVYSGHKVRAGQIDSVEYKYGQSHPYDALGDGHYVRVTAKTGEQYDSAYQVRAHLRGKMIGKLVVLPRR